MNFAWFLIKNTVKDVTEQYFKHWKSVTYLFVTIGLTWLSYDSTTPTPVDGFDTVPGLIFMTYLAVNIWAFFIIGTIVVIYYIISGILYGFRCLKRWYVAQRKEYEDYHKYLD